MSRKSVPRFCDNDMRKNKELKRVAPLKERDALSTPPLSMLTGRKKAALAGLVAKDYITVNRKIGAEYAGGYRDPQFHY